MLNGKIYGRYDLVYLHVWQFHEENNEEVSYKPKNRKRLVNGIVYIREGNATIHEHDSGRVLKVGPGCIMLIPTDVAYTITWKPGVRTHDLADFLFNYDCSIQYHTERGITSRETIDMSKSDVLPSFLPTGRVTVIQSEDDRFVTAFNRLHEAYNSTDDYIAFSINQRFYELIGRLHDSLYSTSQADALDRARIYIDMHCAEQITVAGIAKRFSFDRSYFSRSFKARFGLSPVEYRAKQRMKLAYDIVTSSTRKISEISELLGFSSEAHFRECFKREFGMSPKQAGRPRGQTSPGCDPGLGHQM